MALTLARHAAEIFHEHAESQYYCFARTTEAWVLFGLGQYHDALGIFSATATEAAVRGDKEGIELAKEIIDSHRDSDYYPYALLLVTFVRREKDIPALLEAAETFRNSPTYHYLLKAAGDAARAEAYDAKFKKDAVREADFWNRAQEYYERALATSRLSIHDGAQDAAWQARSAIERLTRQPF